MKTTRTIRRGECPVCRKPFREDAEVGPVPACDCGERRHEEPDPPFDSDRRVFKVNLDRALNAHGHLRDKDLL